MLSFTAFIQNIIQKVMFWICNHKSVLKTAVMIQLPATPERGDGIFAPKNAEQ